MKIWKELAEGIVESAGGNDKALMSYHPQPHNPGGLSTWFHDDQWLDFNMHQTGHCPKNSYINITHDSKLTPAKPVPDGEPLYEDQEDNNDYLIATRVEKGAYAMIYVLTGKEININLDKLKGKIFMTWWFDPRTGNAYRGGDLNDAGQITITPPTREPWNDWVLVIDAENNEFQVPGQVTTMD